MKADARDVLARCHSLAIAAMASVASPPPPAAGFVDGLTARELERLAALPPRVLSAIERALARLPSERDSQPSLRGVGGTDPKAIAVRRCRAFVG
jgi:hypothetical protein